MLNAPEITAPHITFQTVREAIPSHCFERSYVRSFAYLTVNLAAIAIVAGMAVWLGEFWLFWPIYAVVQGCLFSGIWVLAHECGHRAFCSNDFVNDCVGLVLHSSLLVPYHAWRISHGKHHQHTNHVELDEVFLPGRGGEVTFRSVMAESILGRTIFIVGLLVIGWPAYLIANVSGRKYARPANHFSPNSPIFSPRQRRSIVISDLALLACILGLAFWAYMTSWATVALFYGLPYLVANAWLVLITYLQHTDESVPHYDEREWTWLKGALATVDRDFGILNGVFYHITDTHVLHHLFPRIPHYHAVEATQHIKRVLGEQYQSDNTPVFVALWRSVTRCVVLDETEREGVFTWRRLQK